VREIVSVPCSITDTWHALAADEAARGRLRLVMTSHEGNLAGIAGGIWFGTGRAALVHMQNSGLPNAGDGFISFADREVYGVPMCALVTYRGATESDASEPHQAIGRRTDALVSAVFGPEATIEGCRHGRDARGSLERALRASTGGGIGVMKLAESGFAKSGLPWFATGDAPTSARSPAGAVGALPRHMRASRADEARSCCADAGIDARPTRDEAIRAIAARHPNAALLFCNGFTARAARAIVDSPRCFYNIGYMGGTLAIAWGLATSRPDVEVVVVDGDQNALMSAMKEQLRAEFPPNLRWYVLDNGIGASVGTSESIPLGSSLDGLAEVIATRPDEPGSFPHPRVSAVGARFGDESPAGIRGTLQSLSWRFRDWLASSESSAPKSSAISKRSRP
jgi:phosphonopyruvate decarboxylase